MGYGRSYGMSGTAVPEWQQGLKKCKETMSCTKGRCMSYDGAVNKCTCVKCDSELVNRPNSGITPRYSSSDNMPARFGKVAGVNGLGESFLESIGNVANLAIIGLAIYGGFCLAKKL